MGGMAEGETQMKRIRTTALRALVGALLLLTVGASTASADPGLRVDAGGASTQQCLLPEDPGLE